VYTVLCNRFMYAGRIGVYRCDPMTEQMYAVELSTNGYKRTETVAARNPAKARKQKRDEYPNALIYEVNTL